MGDVLPGDAIDLTNCEREPIHLLGAIQPIGFLVALSTDWIVSRVSANVETFVGHTPEQMIGHPLSDFISGEVIHTLRNRLALLRGPDAVERVFRLDLLGNGRPFDVAIHSTGDRVILEGEPSHEKTYGDATGTVRGMISRIDQAEDLDRFFNEGARQVRALTGYDRVMVYRFDPDLSGHVVAESAKGGIGSFLGLHYPASDIPSQARKLYCRSLLRVITDVEAEPVPVVPQLDENKQPLDLSLAVLRSVSPIHIEYLKNMGVAASLSISIIVEGKLWGLFACHHYSPRCPSFERRSVAELFSQMFSMRLESKLRQDTMDYERRARDLSNRLLGAVATDEAMLRDPDWLSDVLTQVIPADGVGVWINGSYAFTGLTPDTTGFAQVIRALNGAAASKVFATDRIADLVPGAERFAAQAAGMLSIPISRSPRDYVVLFRQERIQTVRWAGDPHKPVEYGTNGPRLTPRGSFEEWREVVQGRSDRFTDSEMRIAETLRATLLEVVLRMTDEAQSQRQQASERQELLIAELNHRVRNILSLIRGLIRQSMAGQEGSIEDFVKQIDGRIHALARAHNQITDDHWGPAPLASLIEAELAAFLVEKRDRVAVEGKPVLLKPQAYSTMALVLHELVTNSAKYGSLSLDGSVDLKWDRDPQDNLLIHWCEKDGPTVRKPTRRGFGTTIIEHSVPYDLGGRAKVDYDPDGFKATFSIPARHLEEGGAAPAQKVPTGPAAPPSGPKHESGKNMVPTDVLGGRRVLLVEDSLIIALDAEDILKRLGAGHVTSEGTVAGAIAQISGQDIDVAILDINLGDSDSFPIADQLDSHGIPFMFATGYGEQLVLPERHRARAVLQKPYTLATMQKRLPDILRGLDKDR